MDLVRNLLRKRWIIVGAGAAGLRAARRSVAAVGERRRLLRRGEIRPLRAHWSTVDGMRVYARVSTTEAQPGTLPVVLVHGFGVSSSYFVPAAERLATEFAVYAVDLPGHGKSDTPPEALDVPRLADALVGWLDAVGIERAALVGDSMGAQVVVDAAERYCERVDRLVLIGPALDPAAGKLTELARRFVADGLYERKSLARLVAIDFARMRTRLRAELRFLLRYRIEEKLPHVSAPALVVRGEKDTVAPQAWCDHVAAQIGAEPVVVIPEWGHAVHYSAPREFVEAVAPFLRQCALSHKRPHDESGARARTSYVEPSRPRRLA